MHSVGIHPTNPIFIILLRNMTFAKKSEMDKYKKLRQSYEESGKTKRAFAKETGISVSTLYNRLKKTENNKIGEGRFMSMEITRTPETGTIKIITTQGVTIEIPV